MNILPLTNEVPIWAKRTHPKLITQKHPPDFLSVRKCLDMRVSLLFFDIHEIRSRPSHSFEIF